MANVKITIESNWDHLTREQKDCLCRKYANVLLNSHYKDKVTEGSLFKTPNIDALNKHSDDQVERERE
jgi:hypothetical protein